MRGEGVYAVIVCVSGQEHVLPMQLAAAAGHVDAAAALWFVV